MDLVRSIVAGEVALFASLAQTERVEASYARLAARGETRPEWCFVAFRDGRPIARLGFWTLASEPAHRNVWAARLSGSPGADEAFVRACLAAAAAGGARTVEWRVDGENPAAGELAALVARAGLPLVQEKAHYTLEPLGPGPRPTRLAFRSRRETGDAVFLDAVRRVTEGTLDRMNRRWIEILGPEGEARMTFSGLLDLDDRPDWWALAYGPGGSLAGLVVPQRFDDCGVINYIGVVPAERGHGYAGDLLAHALDALAADGRGRVIADIDVENAPMAAALERAGFARRPGDLVHEAEIGSPPSKNTSTRLGT